MSAHRAAASPLVTACRRLCRELEGIAFAPPVRCVYNPLDYARARAEDYARRYARPGIRALFVGMNPGPFGMVQTGVPFGDPGLVREWLGIEGPVGRPTREHPRRPVLGFDSPRGEVSGQRLWGWARDRFGRPERFFDRYFVWNYCPLAFLEESGRNRTPDKLPQAEQIPLFAACDRALVTIVAALAPEMVIGIGAFAAQRARHALEEPGVPVGQILHPSPASPLANRGWAAAAERQLTALLGNVP